MLIADRVAKRYGGVVALRETTFTVRPGRVHALLGENGAGKSTLVKILTGTVRPDAGTVRLDGVPVTFTSNADAVARGVAVVSQELRLFPDLSVLANLYTLREPRRAGVLIDRSRMRREARPVLDELGVGADLLAPLCELSLADRQLVEIARALLTRPAVILLDEPTSALERASSTRLLNILDVLRRRGVGVVYVSHILEEVLSLSDEITVLRDGATVLSAVDRDRLDVTSIVEAMLGSRLATAQATRALPNVCDLASSAGALVVDGVSVAGRVEPVSLRAEPGEVLGLAGVVGAGHQAVLNVVAGLMRPSSGSVNLPDGRPLPRGRSRAVAAGVATISGDRRRFGLMLDKPLWENVGQVRAVALRRAGPLVRPQRLRLAAEEQMRRLNVRAASVDALAGSLSGGNQQKIVFAKWLTSDPQVLLLDDPTRGVDVGAKAELHRLVRALSDRGVVVMLCSTDIAEMADLCDRVLVFRQRRPVAQLATEELTEHALLEAINTLPDEPAPHVGKNVADAARPPASRTAPPEEAL
jgi:ABC-type sugar transport system ATPase subunit